MKRLWTTVRHDVRLQWRNGFYYAAAVMLALFALLLAQVPRADLRWLLPAVIVNNIVVNGFYFVAGLVLLEKGEGVLQAQVITPLRPGDYLLSKVFSLALLSLLENGLLVLLLLGAGVSAGWLLLGILAATAFFTLLGFLAVVRYERLNEYLLPSLLMVTVLTLPLLPYFGVGQEAFLAPLVYLHPLQAVLLALRAATGATPPGWQTVYILLYTAAFVLVAFRLAQAAYERFVRQAALTGMRRQR